MLSLTTNVQLATSLERNCLACTRYLDCKDPHKSVMFRCDRFKQSKESKRAGEMRVFDFLKLDGDLSYISPDEMDSDSAILKGPRIGDPTADTGFDIAKVIRDIVKNDKVVSSDIKINDRDFLQAPNFYTFCVSDKFLKQK